MACIKRCSQHADTVDHTRSKEGYIMTDFRSILPSGAALSPITEDRVVSNNGRFALVMQRDGNLVLYDTSVAFPPGRSTWNSDTYGVAVEGCVMQPDGNLVIYGYPIGGSTHPNPVWNAGVHAPGSFLTVQDDGRIVIIQPGAPIWHRPPPAQR